MIQIINISIRDVNCSQPFVSSYIPRKMLLDSTKFHHHHHHHHDHCYIIIIIIFRQRVQQ
jgi:hypothetical protein